MFTLGNKEAIVNSTRQYPVTVSSTGVLPGSDDLMVIAGFGTFQTLKLTDFIARRASAAQLDKLKLTCPSAADLGITTIGVPVVVHLRVNSLRQASETAIDFIKRGRPMILEVKIDAGDGANDVATKVAAAFAEYTLKFLNSSLPVTFGLPNVPAAGDIVITATDGWFQINESVTFLKRGDIFALEATTTKRFITSPLRTVNAVVAGGATVISLSGTAGLSVNDTLQFSPDGITFSQQYRIIEIVSSLNDITVFPAVPAVPDVVNGDSVYKIWAGVEAVNDGKYLEENVRMSTPFTSDTYAISPLEVPLVYKDPVTGKLVGANYTMVSWEMEEMTTADGGWGGHKVKDIKSDEFKTNRFTLYLNEDQCNGAGGQTDKILTWALLNAGVVTADDLKKANGAQAEPIPDLVANFLA